MRTQRRAVAELQTSSMADIAFLLLIFFLVTTTVPNEWGLRQVMASESDRENPTLPRNVLEVHLQADGTLMVEGQPTPMAALRQVARRFITNTTNAPDQPMVRTEEVTLLGTMPVSQQAILLQHSEATGYQQYITARNELLAAYRESRNALSEARFGHSFTELQDDPGANRAKIEAIMQVYPQRISDGELLE